MIRPRHLAALVAFALLAGGCAPMYIPNKVNTPVLTHAGELQLGAYLGTSGFDPQINYAVTNHFALMFNGSFQFGKIDSTSASNRHEFAELGLGYYRRISERGRFEIFSGYGIGTVQASYSNSLFTDYSDASLQRFFIQPDIGMSTAVIDAAVAMRFVIVNAKQDNLSLTRSFLEPAVTLKAGFKYIKFVGQVGFSIPFDSNNLVEQQPFIGSIGIQGYINKGYVK